MTIFCRQWDRLEDKYAVTSLAFAGAIALWSTSGMISVFKNMILPISATM